MRYIQLYLAIMLACFAGKALSQNKSFQPGESLKYSIGYQLMGVWVGAGDVTFTVKEEDLWGNHCYKFKGFGTTYPRYDWFYKVRDTYTSYADQKSLQPYRFTRDVSEGGFYYREDNIYRYSDSSVYSVLKVKEKPLKLDTFPIKKNSFDVLSLVYESRSIDFSSKRIGDRILLRMVIDRGTHDIFIRYLGTDTYEHDEFGEIECYVFSPLLVEGSIFKAGEGMKVWVSKDNNRIPIFIESEIRVGTIRSELIEYSGLRFPLGSKSRN
jgi:hypothetical protein